MSDEFDIIHLNQDETQEIVDWAVGTAAMITLMDGDPEFDREDVETMADTIDGYIEAVHVIMENMPDVLRKPAEITAIEAVDSALQEQAVVDEFIEELKDL